MPVLRAKLFHGKLYLARLPQGKLYLDLTVAWKLYSVRLKRRSPMESSLLPKKSSIYLDLTKNSIQTGLRRRRFPMEIRSFESKKLPIKLGLKEEFLWKALLNRGEINNFLSRGCLGAFLCKPVFNRSEFKISYEKLFFSMENSIQPFRI